MSVQDAYNLLYSFALIVLGALIFFCFVRSVLGPSISDRLMAVNMIGTMTIIAVAILSLMLEESYLVDVAMIYAMISFLAVVVITKVYTGVYRENSLRKREKVDD